MVNSNNQLVGTLTDGDIRRGLLAGRDISENVETVMHRNFRQLSRNSFTIADIDALRRDDIELVPLLDDDQKIVKIMSLKAYRTVLPVDALIMAGQGKAPADLVIRNIGLLDVITGKVKPAAGRVLYNSGVDLAAIVFPALLRVVDPVPHPGIVRLVGRVHRGLSLSQRRVSRTRGLARWRRRRD